ncbi:hypothetical protein HID58_018520, partial [Brassica napus]
TQPKAYPSAPLIPILVTTAEPQRQLNQQGKKVNQQNPNQQRSPDDAEREARQMVLSQILFFHSLERRVICLEDVILRAAQMEQIVEKVCEERINTGVSKISVNFYEQFHFFNGWKLTDTICFTSKQFTPMRIS